MKLVYRMLPSCFRNRQRRKVVRQCIRHLFFKEIWRTYVKCDDDAFRRVDMGRHAWHINYCADPFLFHHNGCSWLFYETLDRNGKGVIGCFCEIDGKWIQQGKVLEEPFHLSYPQVFEDHGRIFMIPESCDVKRGGGGVYLYECLNFPHEWIKRTVLIDLPSVDSTLLRKDGVYYLACMVNGTAQLWVSHYLDKGWSLHPQSRHINTSRRLRRNGGAFWNDGSTLFRVAQDCNGGYGKRLFRIPILKLSDSEYSEGSAEILIDRNYKLRGGGRHTYNVIITDGHVYVAYDEQEYCLRSMGGMMLVFCDLLMRFFGKLAR